MIIFPEYEKIDFRDRVVMKKKSIITVIHGQGSYLKKKHSCVMTLLPVTNVSWQYF